jgi:hypothetical protein
MILHGMMRGGVVADEMCKGASDSTKNQNHIDQVTDMLGKNRVYR